jgi:hypothetical protein
LNLSPWQNIQFLFAHFKEIQLEADETQNKGSKNMAEFSTMKAVL